MSKKKSYDEIPDSLRPILDCAVKEPGDKQYIMRCTSEGINQKFLKTLPIW